MSLLIEDHLPVVKHNGLNTDKAVVMGSTLAVTGAITATGGVVGAVTGAITGNVTGNLTGNVTGNVTGNTTGTHTGAVSASTLSSTGTTFLAYPTFDGVVTDYDAQAAVLTVAGMAGGTVEQNSQTGASTLTTPTGAQITAAFGDVTGTTIDVYFLNRGNQTSTITAGDGSVQVKGTAAIATTKTAIMRFVNVSTGAWKCYVIAAA